MLHKIETNLSRTLEFREGESLTTVFSSLAGFSTSHTDVSDDFNLRSESQIDEELLQYLFEKNVIVFLMDSGKKLAACKNVPAFGKLDGVFNFLELIVVKKAFIQNYYIFQVMQNKIDIFGIPGLDKLASSAAYADLLLFFREFNDFTRQLFQKLKTDYLCAFPRAKDETRLAEEADVDSVNGLLGARIAAAFAFYKKTRESLAPAERQLLLQTLVYLLYNRNSTEAFTFERFPHTEDWVAFCRRLNGKEPAEMEKVLEAFAANK